MKSAPGCPSCPSLVQFQDTGDGGNVGLSTVFHPADDFVPVGFIELGFREALPNYMAVRLATFEAGAEASDECICMWREQLLGGMLPLAPSAAHMDPRGILGDPDRDLDCRLGRLGETPSINSLEKGRVNLMTEDQQATPMLHRSAAGDVPAPPSPCQAAQSVAATRSLSRTTTRHELPWISKMSGQGTRREGRQGHPAAGRETPISRGEDPDRTWPRRACRSLECRVGVMLPSQASGRTGLAKLRERSQSSGEKAAGSRNRLSWYSR